MVGSTVLMWCKGHDIALAPSHKRSTVVQLAIKSTPAFLIRSANNIWSTHQVTPLNDHAPSHLHINSTNYLKQNHWNSCTYQKTSEVHPKSHQFLLTLLRLSEISRYLRGSKASPISSTGKVSSIVTSKGSGSIGSAGAWGRSQCGSLSCYINFKYPKSQLSIVIDVINISNNI